MADRMTPEQRRRCMAAVKSRNTRPEMTVRRFLFAKGLRYRLCNPRLPGSPDIVLAKYKTVIFIDGCFWHGHEGCRYFRMPQSNTDFWRHKINMNIARDYRANVELRLRGWRVIRLWECEIKDRHTSPALLDSLYRTITGRPTAYALPADTPRVTAAEPLTPYQIK